MKVFAMLLVVALIPGRAIAQRTQYENFSDLKPDGSGVSVLRTTVTTGYSGRTAGSAFAMLATQAQISLTLEASHRNFQVVVNIPAHERTVAAALLEIAQLANARVLVSRSGQLVVSPNEGPTPVAADRRVDTATAATGLPEVHIEAARTERLAFERSPSVSTLRMNADALRRTPAFIEPDVLRSIRLLPGIETRSDWSAGFNVRGGESDQSLVLLDGYPIYNPYHLGGVFSTFIDPAVGKVELYTGGLPSRYGGRLSGALDVSSFQPTTETRHGSIEVSLISSIASVGRTFDDGQGSWMIAARRSYADALVNLFKRNAFPYHFEDLQSHVSRQLARDLTISTTAYYGRDVASGDSTDAPYGGWGNGILGVTLSKRLAGNNRWLGISTGDSAVVEQRASWTRFWAVADINNFRSRVDNDVTDMRLSGSFRASHETGTTTIGYELSSQQLRYQAASLFNEFGDLFPIDSTSRAVQSAALYFSRIWRPSSRLLVDLGGRYELTNIVGSAGFSPRLSAKYFLSKDVALTAGAGRYAQWMQSLGRSEEPFQPFQFWVAAPRGAKASVMYDGVLGLEQWRSPTQLVHVGAYVKRYDRLYVPNVNSDPLVPNDELKQTKGSSYGLDFLWRKLESDDGSGWLSYSYAFGSRTDPDGYTYAPSQDRRHNLNFVWSWRAEDYTIGFRANFASGLPTTPIEGQFVRFRYDPITHRYQRDNAINNQSISAAYNSDRLPSYQRIDLSITRHTRLFGYDARPYLSIVNILNTQNPAGFLYTFSGRAQRASLPNLPFVPSLGVSIAF